MGAIILDILIVIIVFYLNIFVNKYLKLNNYLFLLLQLFIQIIHDILFYYFFYFKKSKWK